ncbi:hypothetical protein [Microvirga sp. Mcv34]|uniref:hypothetical protein n=1 Tax=Microvirga sp. Mcv34 TaxID=2926016 RepID=UPI0021C8DACD|nr:hypothetical protein [Microvirga sp. Mcv34]
MSTRERKPNKLNSLRIKSLNERLAARRQTKETLTQIADDFGVTLQTVAYHAKKLPPSIRFKASQQLDDAEVLRLYGVHMSLKLVAQELGVSSPAVSKALARMEWKAAA